MLKHILVLVGLLILFASGCTYKGPLQSLPPVATEEAATIVVIVEKIFPPMRPVVAVIDGKEVYAIGNNQYVIFHVTPGSHTVIGKRNDDRAITNKSIAEFSLKTGETVYLYFERKVFSTLDPHTIVSQIPEAQAKELMKNATRVGPQ